MSLPEPFGTLPDGQAVQRITLRGGGLTARFLTWGAVLQDLRLDGHDAPLVLGLNDLPDYLAHSRYFGATAGRCANRIRDGHLALNGTTYQLDRNFLGKHLLHGGAGGTGKRLWTVAAATDSALTLACTLPDGDMGFPGNLTLAARFALLPGGVLDICYSARTDADTLCNIAQHSYFNLDGGPDLSDHLLTIDAFAYLPVDDELIPTGEIAAMAVDGYDFRQPRCPGAVAGAIDHNYCLSATAELLRPVAWLQSRRSGVAMTVKTTEPGLQVYNSTPLTVPVPGLGGRRYGAHAGLALEPQIWPDANHHPRFPQALLRTGDSYEQHTQFIFAKDRT